MPCTTILVGKKASYDGSTMIARNDDSGAGHYTSKKFVVIQPEEQPRTYKTEISHLTIELPDNPMRYTAVPNAEKGEGVWAASGVNAAQVGMTATETITSNPRVLGADPLVVYQPAEDGKEEVPGALDHEDEAAGLLDLQLTGVGVGHEARLPHHLKHLLLRFGPHIGPVVDDPGDGAHRAAAQPCDVFDG